MTIRTTLSHVSRQATMSSSRATIREFDDDHLMQEVKKADVFHSETPSDFERWQMVGLTSFPVKQQEEEGGGQQKSKSSSKEAGSASGEMSDDQPKGPAAEAVMLYLNGQRSHPVALVDDRRVRPYEMSEGEGAHYAPDGSEQMVLFKETGTYVISLDNVSVKDKKNKKTRFVSLRHVTKKMQTHKIEKNQQQGGQQASGGGGGGSAGAGTLSASTRAATTGTGASGGGQQQQKEKYKHEGESVNTEIRCTAGRIEFRAGDSVVGYYDKGSETWYLKGKIVELVGDTTSIVAKTRAEIVGKTYLGLDAKGDAGPKVLTEDGPAKQTWAKV